MVTANGMIFEFYDILVNYCYFVGISPPLADKTCRVEPWIAYSGGDLEMVQSDANTAEECSQKCIDLEACSAFTWSSDGTKQCRLTGTGYQRAAAVFRISGLCS